MLLGCQHEDCKDELGREEHFDKEAASDGGFWRQGRLHKEISGKERADDGCCAEGTKHLGDEADDHSQPSDGTDKSEGEGDLVHCQSR